MREIKYRGKRLDNGEWAYGYIREIFSELDPNGRFVICPAETFSSDGWEDLDEVEVDPATVGQYTGLKDKNGKEIYEGDVLRWFVNDLISTAPVEYRDGAFWMVRDINTGHGVWNDWLRGEYEILGNIHDNPELLKTE